MSPRKLTGNESGLYGDTNKGPEIKRILSLPYQMSPVGPLSSHTMRYNSVTPNSPIVSHYPCRYTRSAECCGVSNSKLALQRRISI